MDSSPGLARHLEIDRIADRFESAWRSGTSPELGSFAAGTPADLRAELLWELIQIDIEYRHRAGQQSTPADYLQRFPEIAPFLSSSPEIGMSATSQPIEPPIVPRYEIRRLIGTGGMGAVWEAQQQHPRRAVALKVIRPGMVSRELLHRFDHEAEILGRLKHIGIAQIHEAGTFDSDGVGPRPFLAMELVRGLPITDHAQLNHLNLHQRLRLLAQVCDAVQAAHQNGIIHRDLKPANVLVDESGQPKILDFGVARIIDASARDASMATDAGQLLGTLQYMSPEQAGSRSNELDGRTDVFSLGVIGYELLSQRRPLNLDRRSIPEAVRSICEDEPEPLSSIDARFRGDVETIIAKAMEKERDRRYPTAEAMAADLRSYLADEPIAARRPTTWYQLRRFARRNRVLVGGVIATFVVLVLGIVATTTQMIRAQAAEASATMSREKEAIQRRRAQANERLAVESQHRAENSLALSTIAQADALVAAGRVFEARGLYDQARSIFGELKTSDLPADLGQFTAETAAASPAFTIAAHHDVAMAVVVTPDGRLIISASHDNTVRVWNALTGAAVKTLEGTRDMVLALAISPDGKTVAAAGGDAYAGKYKHPNPDQTVKVWNLESGKLLAELSGHTAAVRTLAFSHDGKVLASAGDDKTIRLWDASGANLTPLRTLDYPVPIRSIVFAGNDRILCAGAENVIRLINAGDGSRICALAGHHSNVYALALSRDGSTVISSAEDHTIKVWDMATASERNTLVGHTAIVNSVAVSPDGHAMISASSDGSARVWDLETGTESRKLCGSQGPLLCAIFMPDGRSAVSCGWEGAIQKWDIAAEPEVRTFVGHQNFVRSVAFSPDGLLAASGSWDHTVALWDLATGNRLKSFSGYKGYVHAVAFSPDGTRLATASGSQLRVWDVTRGKIALDVPQDATAACVQFSPDGKMIAVGGDTRMVQVIDATNGTIMHTLRGHSAPVLTVAWSPDGKSLLSGSQDTTLVLWDVASGTAVRKLTGHTGQVASVAISPDGKFALSGSWDDTIKLWNLTTGKEIRTYEGHLAQGSIVWSVAFSPDGTMAISGGQDGTLRFWSTIDSTNLRTIDAQCGQVYAVALASDGRQVLTGGADGTVKLWDFTRPAMYRQLRSLTDLARQTLALHPDDRQAARTLAEWSDFRGMHSEACDYLERSGNTSALFNARCYWKAAKTEQATSAFNLARQNHEAPDWYLNLCTAAIEAPSTRQ